MGRAGNSLQSSPCKRSPVRRGCGGGGQEIENLLKVKRKREGGGREEDKKC